MEKKHIRFTTYPFLSVQFSSIKFFYTVVKQISRKFSSCLSEILPFPSAPGNYHSTFCFYEFDCFRYFV